MFLSFAEDEKRHLTILKEILSDLKFSDFDRFFEEKNPREKIKTIFREVKSEIKERIAANPDELEALKIGMDMESKSVEFYQGALEKTQDSHQKAFFNRLIDEEKEHYEMLEMVKPGDHDLVKKIIEEEKKHVRRLSTMKSKLTKA